MNYLFEITHVMNKMASGPHMCVLSTNIWLSPFNTALYLEGKLFFLHLWIVNIELIV